MGQFYNIDNFKPIDFGYKLPADLLYKIKSDMEKQMSVMDTALAPLSAKANPLDAQYTAEVNRSVTEQYNQTIEQLNSGQISFDEAMTRLGELKNMVAEAKAYKPLIEQSYANYKNAKDKNTYVNGVWEEEDYDLYNMLNGKQTVKVDENGTVVAQPQEFRSIQFHNPFDVVSAMDKSIQVQMQDIVKSKLQPDVIGKALASNNPGAIKYYIDQYADPDQLAEMLVSNFTDLDDQTRGKIMELTKGIIEAQYNGDKETSLKLKSELASYFTNNEVFDKLMQNIGAVNILGQEMQVLADYYDKAIQSGDQAIINRAKNRLHNYFKLLGYSVHGGAKEMAAHEYPRTGSSSSTPKVEQYAQIEPTNIRASINNTYSVKVNDNKYDNYSTLILNDKNDVSTYKFNNPMLQAASKQEANIDYSDFPDISVFQTKADSLNNEIYNYYYTSDPNKNLNIEDYNTNYAQLFYSNIRKLYTDISSTTYASFEKAIKEASKKNKTFRNLMEKEGIINIDGNKININRDKLKPIYKSIDKYFLNNSISNNIKLASANEVVSTISKSKSASEKLKNVKDVFNSYIKGFNESVFKDDWKDYAWEPKAQSSTGTNTPSLSGVHVGINTISIGDIVNNDGKVEDVKYIGNGKIVAKIIAPKMFGEKNNNQNKNKKEEDKNAIFIVLPGDENVTKDDIKSKFKTLIPKKVISYKTKDRSVMIFDSFNSSKEVESVYDYIGANSVVSSVEKQSQSLSNYVPDEIKNKITNIGGNDLLDIAKNNLFGKFVTYYKNSNTIIDYGLGRTRLSDGKIVNDIIIK